MDAEAAVHRQIRQPLTSLGLLLIVACFAVAPLAPFGERVMGTSAQFGLSMASLAAVAMLATGFAYRRFGLRSGIYRALNRLETATLATLCLATIMKSGNAASAVWALHFGHLVGCGSSGGERRFNLAVFSTLSAVTVGFFAVTQGLGAGALAAAIAGVALSGYSVMSATTSQLTQTRADRDRLEAELASMTIAQERARIARDLHDGVGTELSSLFWQLQSLRAAATTPEAMAVFDALSSRITQSTDELRSVVWELRATSLSWPELLAHLRTRCSELAGDEARVTLVGDETAARDVPGDVRLHIARIVQEAVRNAIHHGRARHLTIRLTLAEALRIEVDDDGRGIAPDASRRSVGGLRNLDVRVRSLGGVFSIAPREGGGTRLHAEIPLAAAAPPGASSVG
ncbi:MAG: hypothetical protein IAE78_15365 [Myxococcus sp.]|nr:hypothetical protein [Myxococcus sp.]